MSRLSSDLLKQARDLAFHERRRPKDASVRRSISTAYYALFHFLLDEASRIVIGRTQKDKPLRDLLCRCFQHRSMKDACKRIYELSANSVVASKSVYAPFAKPLATHSKDLQTIAKTFQDLQEHRHRADYDLRKPYTRIQASKAEAETLDDPEAQQCSPQFMPL
jgi:uncharacterized protein (UPF0332 family)